VSGIGHNNGPTMEPGAGWRRYAWKRARADLLPKLPLEIVRLRVRRARELGLDYKTYAGVRASTGRDLVAFLFSSNALRVGPQVAIIPAERAAKLSGVIDCRHTALVHGPLDAARLLTENAPLIDTAGAAPTLLDGWSATREKVAAVLGKIPRDGVLVIGDTGFEREWSMAGKLAGFLPSDRYFTAD